MYISLFKELESLQGDATYPSFEAVYCFICSRRRVAVARYRMICLVLGIMNNKDNPTGNTQHLPIALTSDFKHRKSSFCTIITCVPCLIKIHSAVCYHDRKPSKPLTFDLKKSKGPIFCSWTTHILSFI